MFAEARQEAVSGESPSTQQQRRSDFLRPSIDTLRRQATAWHAAAEGARLTSMVVGAAGQVWAPLKTPARIVAGGLGLAAQASDTVASEKSTEAETLEAIRDVLDRAEDNPQQGIDRANEMEKAIREGTWSP